MSQVRHVNFPSGDITLEGQLHLPDTIPVSGQTPARRGGIVVCHPHPQYGGDMHNNIVDAICETAVANGVGEQEDVRAALTYLRELPEADSERIALAGYSFGAGVAVHVASDPDLRALVAVSLPTTMPLEGVTIACPALFVSGDEDEYSDADDLTEFVRGLGPQAELRLLPGLGHFWFGVERDLKEIVAPFLRAHLLGITTA